MQKDILQRLIRIDHLIRIKGTGTPVQLADKLGMSERSVYEYLNLMKEFGAPIKFDSYRETYYYEKKDIFISRFCHTLVSVAMGKILIRLTSV